MKKHLIVCLFAIGCTKQKPIKTTSDTEELRKQVALYIDLANKQKDSYGWLGPKCDGLLFNSLAAVAGVDVDPMKAEESPGRWRRHPDFEDCRPFKNSRSTISRDMFRGLFIYLLLKKDREALLRIKDYGEDHKWFMGEGENEVITISRTWFNPAIRGQLYRMIENSPMFTKEYYTEDYEAHLEAWNVFTEYLIDGHIDEWNLKILKDHRERQPENALFHAMASKFIDGNMDKAISLLQAHFPPDRLPTEADHFAHYLYQRDFGPDWQPCNNQDEKRRCKGLTHNGVDFLIVAWLILN